jgi:hypothetical protein
MAGFDPKKLGEEADQMIKELNQQAEERESVPVAEDQSGDTDAIAQEVVAEVVDDQGAQSDTTVSEPQVASNVELDLLRKQMESAEQKWRVLQGMINKKDDEIEQMRQLFAQLNSQRPEPAAEPVVSLDFPDLEKEFDAGLIAAVRQVSGAVVASALAQFEQKMLGMIGKLEGSVQHVEKTAAKTQQDLFFDALTDRVPTWRELNTDSSYLSWLEQLDAFAGVPRLQLLQDAVSQGDVARSAMFFEAYKREAGLDAPVVTQTAAPVQAAASAKDKLAKIAAPGRSKVAATKSDTEKRMWSRTDIAKLYDDKMAGRISASEFNELERDMFAAQHDGRIAA